MKRLFLFTLVALLAVGLQAQTYHPFVERGKRWCVHGFSMGSDHTVTDYYFSPENNQLERNGHSYEQLCARTQDGNDKPLGWFREENQRVYMYNEEEDKEVLTYDFSLKVGDRFEPEYGDFEHCEVTKIDYLMVYGDSLKVINFRGKDKTSSLSVLAKGRWIEGIGSEMNPLDGLFSHSAPNSWSYYLAYVSGSSYWPFTFSQHYNGWWGQDLARGEEDQDYARTHSFNENDLHYELVPDPVHDAYALHVSGIMWLPCGGDLYIYCRRERTEDISAYKLYLQEDVAGEVTTCKSPYHVDLSFPFFLAEHKYTVVDERGEHPVAVRDVSYRPFIEEGKVWKVGYFMGESDRASMLYYYYFDGDTIINNRSCTKMVCRHEAAESWGSTELWTKYVGAVYEENRKVYYAYPEEDQLILLYDFASPVDEPVVIYNMSFEVMSQGFITKRSYSESETYKGTITYVGQKENGYEGLLYIWMEGVGNSTYPISHVYYQTLEYASRKLMSCTVGDEVLYNNPSLVDGVTPEGADVKKQWIDFTHIKKPRPKAPARERTANETDEENLTGEYSVKQLFVNLKILSGTYTVTLKDAADNVVYHKDVQTSSTIALTTDLTKYPAGTYTLVVENSEEQYTATLTLPLDDTAVRDLPSIVNCKLSNCKWYDLSGRQIRHSSFLKGQASKLERITRHLPRGIYILDGKKVVVK